MMEYDKTDTDKVRAEIISTLEVMGRYNPRSPKLRKFINDLIEIPVDESLISRIREVNESEGILRSDEDIVTHLYVSNLSLGLEALEMNDVDNFLEEVRGRFNVNSPLNV